jgi:hypothetical protein
MGSAFRSGRISFNAHSIRSAFVRSIVAAPLLLLLIDEMNECKPALWQRLSRSSEVSARYRLPIIASVFGPGPRIIVSFGVVGAILHRGAIRARSCILLRRCARTARLALGAGFECYRQPNHQGVRRDQGRRSDRPRRGLAPTGGRNAHPATWAPFVVVGEGAR